MPDCAPEITGRVKPGEAWPDQSDRGWRAKKDYTPEQLGARRDEIRAKASGQKVETFIADEWTLEYDLARAGLSREVFIAARLAIADERIAAGKLKPRTVIRQALQDLDKLARDHPDGDEFATYIYKPFLSDSRLSKATAAHYLSSILQSRSKRGRITAEKLRTTLPRYIVAAIEHVTLPPQEGTPKEISTAITVA